MRSQSNIPLEKNPGNLGFFSFLIRIFIALFLLQWLSRGIFLFHRQAVSSISIKEVFQTFLHGFRLDLAFACYLYLPLLALVLVCVLLKKKLPVFVIKSYLLIAVVFVVFITAADAELFRNWGSKINRQALDYAKHPREAMASSSEALWGKTILYALLIGFVYFKYAVRKKHAFSYGSKVSVLGTLAIVILSIIAARGGLSAVPISQSSAYFSASQTANLAAVNSGWNFIYYVVNKSDNIDYEAYNPGGSNHEQMASSILGFGKDKAMPLWEGESPNVVTIILESYSASLSKFFGNTYNYTPFLDSLARTGLSFTQAYAPGDRTDKGIAAVLSGWPGQPWQSILNEPDKAIKLPTISREFKGKGYATTFFYGGDLNFANMGAYIRSAGFDVVKDVHSMPGWTRDSKWGMHDETLFKQAIDGLNATHHPFLSTILTLSSHEPFEVPGKTWVQGNDEYHKFFNSIAYTDNCLRLFFKQSSTTPWFKNTIFVLVADHGRNIGLPMMEFDQPAHFHIPIVVWGSPLLSSYKGKKLEHTVSQAGIPVMLFGALSPKSSNPFHWARNPLAGDSLAAALYLYSGGIGIVSDKTSVIFHNTPPSMVQPHGNPTKVEEILKSGRSAQYLLLKKYKDL